MDKKAEDQMDASSKADREAQWVGDTYDENKGNYKVRP